MTQAIISAIATCLPERVLTNEELATRPGMWPAEEIFAKTGIRERHIAADGETAADLAVKAAERLFADNNLDRQQIDYLLFCTQSPDHFLPATACLIQERLGLPRAIGALDFNQGCSGFIYGLSLGRALIESGQARSVLLLTAETYSKYIHPRDRSVATLFGDAACATLLSADDGPAGVGEFVFSSDGRGGKNLIVPTGGHRQARSVESGQPIEDEDGNIRSRDNLYMNGREIFRFAITEVPKTVRQLLEKSGRTADDIDFFVLHQANRYMLDELVKRLKVPAEKVPYEFEDVGNTVSSTIPIVLDRMSRSGRLRSGNKLVLVGFGVGYSWAGCMVTWR